MSRGDIDSDDLTRCVALAERLFGAPCAVGLRPYFSASGLVRGWYAWVTHAEASGLVETVEQGGYGVWLPLALERLAEWLEAQIAECADEDRDEARDEAAFATAKEGRHAAE